MNKVFQEDLDIITSDDLNWDHFKDKKILITGAGGFLGGYLVGAFAKANYKYNLNINIVCSVRKIKKNSWLYEESIKLDNLDLIETDLNVDQFNINENDVNIIIHAASQASPKFYSIDPIGTMLPNIIGTKNLLDFACKQKKFERFLFVSSSEIYGYFDESSRINESSMGVIDPFDIRSCYSESKRAGETLCISYAKQKNIPIQIIRPFHTYGLGLKEDDGRVFADFAFNIAKNKDIKMNSSGDAVRAFCHAIDAIRGVFFILIKGEINKAFNLANEEGVLSIKELSDLLVSLFPDKKLKVEQNIPDSNYLVSKVRFNVPDTKNLKKLGWVPKINPEKGFKRFIIGIESKIK
jgi:nucleoside-diphosphate-sugar epimerase